jgi:hypothetical protein
MNNHDVDRLISLEIFFLIDPVDLQITAILLLNDPCWQRSGQGNIGAGSSDKPLNAPGVGDMAKCFRIGGGEHQVVITKKI